MFEGVHSQCNMIYITHPLNTTKGVGVEHSILMSFFDEHVNTVILAQDLPRPFALSIRKCSGEAILCSHTIFRSNQ